MVHLALGAARLIAPRPPSPTTESVATTEIRSPIPKETAVTQIDETRPAENAAPAAKSDRSYAPHLRRAAAPEAHAYQEFAAAAMKNTEGQVPVKYRELIAIGVALTTQCEMCLESHVAAAHAAGATREEIAETTFVTAALRAGGAYTHGMKALRMLDQHTH